MTDESEYDLEFFWDPVCPFAWITSRWVNLVIDQTGEAVDWRFIALRKLNKHLDYERDFPPEYEHGHTAGLRMLRVAAAIRAELGRDPIGPLYTSLSSSIFDQNHNPDYRWSLGTVEMVSAALRNADLPEHFANAVDDESWDEEIEAETELALSRTGQDVGTPIITFDPPHGMSFFGPVISRIPDPEDALTLWNTVRTLVDFPGFAELKRSLRERPQLSVYGEVPPSPEFEDWKGGARRDHLPK